MKKWMAILLVCVMVVTSLLCKESLKCEEANKEKFTKLNPTIEVGNQVYLQHGEDGKDIYDLKKSASGITRVYQQVLAEFTADKAWTKDGQFVDNPISPTPVGATDPEKYIPVVAGEKYYIKAYGVGYTKDKNNQIVWMTPVLFLDKNNQLVADMLTNTVSKSKAGVEITVPENASKMHLTMYNNQSFTIQKALDLTDKEFDALPVVKREELEANIDKAYTEYKQDQTLIEKLDKCHITFVHDDTRPNISTYADLFTEKKIPLVLATVPESLIENADGQKETRLQSVQRIVAAGGEVMAHNGLPLTKEGFDDYNTMFSYFVRTKQMFAHYNFDVNGIILSGGVGLVTGAQESERWVSSLFSYSDLYGMEYDKKEFALDSAYYHWRTAMSNLRSFDAVKGTIDKGIENKSWIVFYFHDANDVSTELLTQVLDYVKAKEGKELEIVTYKQMYSQHAKKESELLAKRNTYYVASTGTSTLGLSAEDPMSYETAREKTYLSGDTILFKRGDTFYGSFSPKISKVDDQYLTISAYGKGDAPLFSAYKIVGKKAAWEVHSQGIYKVDLTKEGNFTGLLTSEGDCNNIGFMEDGKGVKYFKKKSSLEGLQEAYDFYSAEGCLYVKLDKNPYEAVGSLKLATRTNLLSLKSGMKIVNLHFSGTGAHALVGADKDTDHVVIESNIIENVGGSYLKGETRYGNGIEFYGSNVSDVTVQNNLIRNVYDVGFTIQGVTGSGKNVKVKSNVFVQNSQDSEIWESNNATGIESYEFSENLSIGVGRGWGYDARPDQYVSAHVLFWAYNYDNTDIQFHHNIVYHPRRVYFIANQGNTSQFFHDSQKISSNYNTYYLDADTPIYRDQYKLAEKEEFLGEYQKDVNSVFKDLASEQVKDAETLAGKSLDITSIKALFGIQPFVTERPVATPIATPNPTKAADQTAQQVSTNPPSTSSTDGNTIKKGSIFYDKNSNAMYQVTKLSASGGSVSFCGLVNKKTTKLSVPKKLSYQGRSYKVTAISEKALYKCTKLNKLSIGANVAKIGKNACYGCKNLKILQINTSKLTKKNVGKNAFKGLGSKVTLKLPKGKKKAYKDLLKARGMK